MGTCDSQSKSPINKVAIKENNKNQQLEQTNKNYSNNMQQLYLNHKESIITHSKPFIEIGQDISKRLSKQICRIIIETKNEKIIGTGFILAFSIDIEWFYCFVTNDHIINNESINKNVIIYIIYEEFKTVCIKLDKNKRYIKSFMDKGLDITVIEILDEDNINKKYYLYPELNIQINNIMVPETKTDLILL